MAAKNVKPTAQRTGVYVCEREHECVWVCVYRGEDVCVYRRRVCVDV